MFQSKITIFSLIRIVLLNNSNSIDSKIGIGILILMIVKIIVSLQIK